MKRLLSIFLCILLGILPSLAAALTIDEIDRQVDANFKKSGTVGGALVVFLGGEIVYTRYYGCQDAAQETPATKDTYFRLASVTKMVSGIGLMQLCELGLLELDRDISDYFGYEIANYYYPDTPITLRQIMSHTSSIYGTLPAAGRSVYSTLAKAERKYAYYTKKRPGSSYEYSNFGAGIAGAMMEAVTDMSVNSYMCGNVFAPLAIDAAYSASLLSEPEFVSSFYDKSGKLYRSAQTSLEDEYEDYSDPETHYDITIGDLWMRAEDLAKLAIALCGDGSVDGVRLLTEESISLMRTDQSSLEGSVTTSRTRYGLFLQRDETLIDGHLFFGHQGMKAGILCNVYFEPSTGFGFVMLTNGCNNALDNHVGILARRQFVYAYETFADSGDAESFWVQE